MGPGLDLWGLWAYCMGVVRDCFMPLSFSPCCDLQSKKILWVSSYGEALDCVAWSSKFARQFADEGVTLSLANPLSSIVAD